jgi:osmotically-inducible protein OsmY
MDAERRHPSDPRSGRAVFRLAAGLLFAGAALAADGSGAAQTGTGERPPDDVLMQSVIDRIIGAGASFFADIQLDIIDGDALLTGRVATVQDKARATALVRSVPGVQTVTNAIDVGTANDLPRITSDLLLERAIRKEMRAAFGAQMPRLSWRVINGVVYVFGHARSEWEHNRALAVIKQVKGIGHVVDYLRLSDTTQ